MTDGVFLDTVGLIALLNRDDQYHDAARTVFTDFGQAQRRLVTTNLVLAEVGNGLARTALREDVAWLVEQLHTDPLSTVVHVDRRQFMEAVDLYRSRRDKQWGLVDCVSFAVMRALGLAEAFTADHHFEQAGFNVLLLREPPA